MATSRLHALLRTLLGHLLLAAVRSLPPRTRPDLGTLLGLGWWALDRRRRARVAANLDVALGPPLNARARRRLVRAVFRSMALVPLEMAWFPRLLSSRRAVERRCTFRGPWPATPDAQPAGVMVSGHLGNWEALLHAAPHRLGPLRAVARPLPQPEFDALATALRGGPDRVLPKHGAYRGLVRTLQAGVWVALACDQQAGARGPFVPFFGLAASTAAGPARLALRQRAVLWLATAVRRPGRELHYDVLLDPVADGAVEAARGTPAEVLVARLQRALETRVRQAPEQYNFLYRRWKHAPPGEGPEPRRPRYDRRVARG